MSGLEARFNLQDPVVRGKQKDRQLEAWTIRYLRDTHPLSPEQLEECRRDPAWEARNGITDELVCRLCGAHVKTPLHNKLSHLQKRHPGVSTDDYLRAFPAAPLSSLAAMAKYNGKRRRTVDEVLAERLNDYATPEERDECRNDPNWESSRGMSEFVVCRHCGFKSRSELRDDRTGCHLNTHFMTKKQYVELYPGAPWRPEVRAVVQKGLGKKWRDKQRAYLEKLQSLAERVGKGRTATKADIFATGHKMRLENVRWSTITRKLDPDGYRNNPKTAIKRMQEGVRYHRKKIKFKS